MKQKGFTLMELLVVIAIIALLSAAAFFTVQNVQARARDAKRVSDIDQLRKALNLYTTQTGNTFPVATVGICLDGNDIVNQALQANNLISAPIKDPVYASGPNCMAYATDNAGTEFSIRYYLETSSVGPKGLNTIK